MPSRRTFLLVVLPTWLVIFGLTYTFRDTLRNVLRVADGSIEIPAGPGGVAPTAPVEIPVPERVPYSITTLEFGRYLDGFRDGFAAQRWWQGG